MSRITITGRVDDSGKLRLNMNELNEQLKPFKNCRASVIVELFPGGDTEVMKSWYRNHVLPKVIQSWRELGEAYTPDQADEQLRRLTTTCHKTLAGEPVIVPIEGLGRPELHRYLEEVKIFSSMNLNLVL